MKIRFDESVSKFCRATFNYGIREFCSVGINLAAPFDVNFLCPNSLFG